MTTTKNYGYGYGGYTLDADALSQLRTLYKDISGNVLSASDGVDRGVAVSLYKFILALGLALAGQHLLSAAYGQSQPPSEQAEDSTPWPVLDDGRVVFMIYDVKLAMPTCALCLDYKFRSADVGGRVSDRYAPTVRDVIAHPERLRYIAANSDRVELELWNDWRPEANRGPFLGRTDPKSLPRTAFMYLIIYKHSRAEPCWTGPQPDAECQAVHYVDEAERHEDQTVAGMNILRRPFRSTGSAGGPIPPFGKSFYVAPTSHPRDAIGLPIRFDCDLLKTCENSALHTGRGFALRRDVDLFFTFREDDFPPSEWVDLHDRTTDAVRSLFLD